MINKTQIPEVDDRTFKQLEEKSRQRFVDELGKYFKKIIPTENRYDKYDLDATGQTNTRFKIEIKERGDKYSVYTHSGSTFMEDVKRDYFKECIKYDKDIVCIYFIFFKDGWISFNINERFKAGTSEILYSFGFNMPNINRTTYSIVEKKVCELRYNNEYKDRMKVYEN